MEVGLRRGVSPCLGILFNGTLAGSFACPKNGRILKIGEYVKRIEHFARVRSGMTFSATQAGMAEYQRKMLERYKEAQCAKT